MFGNVTALLTQGAAASGERGGHAGRVFSSSLLLSSLELSDTKVYAP